MADGHLSLGLLKDVVDLFERFQSRWNLKHIPLTKCKFQGGRGGLPTAELASLFSPLGLECSPKSAPQFAPNRSQ
jgi:hypothetical protein